MRPRPIAILLVLVRAACADPGHLSPYGSVTEQDRETARFWQARLDAHPDDPMARSSLAVSLLKLARASGEHADLRAAESAFRAVLKSEPSSTTATYGLAYALLGQHRFREALEFAQKALDLCGTDKGSDEIRALVGDVRFGLGDLDEAETIFGELMAKKLTLESLSRMAVLKQARGDDAQAAALMRDAFDAGTALGAPPTSRAWCLSMLGDFAFELGRYDDARRECEAAIDLDPACHHARWRLAQINIRRGRPAQALAAMQSLVAQYPKPAYLITLAEALEHSSLPTGHERACEALDRAEQIMVAELERNDLGHIRELAEFWVANGGDASRAASIALRDLREVRHDGAAYDTAAWALFKAGRVEEAVPLAIEAARRAPGDARVLCRAGVVLCAAGHADEGSPFIRRGLSRNPMLDESLATEARQALAKAGVAE